MLAYTYKEQGKFVLEEDVYKRQVFKREYNQSFVDFVNSTKMEYACHLLEEKKMMVMEIAHRLGYELSLIHIFI